MSLPHAGIRYSTIKVDEYEVKADGLLVANVGSSTANIISVPVGLTLERTIDFGDDLKVKPALNASLTFNFGDTEADFNTTFIGLAADNLKAEIVDDVTYGIGAGLSVTKSNVVVNAGINYLGSENTDSIDVFLKGAYNF
ncbi:MAG: autotransporter outer membrane beta-barrel domain-containing protein [Succinivibrio sp.]